MEPYQSIRQPWYAQTLHLSCVQTHSCAFKPCLGSGAQQKLCYDTLLLRVLVVHSVCVHCIFLACLMTTYRTVWFQMIYIQGVFVSNGCTRYSNIHLIPLPTPRGRPFHPAALFCSCSMLCCITAWPVLPHVSAGSYHTSALVAVGLDASPERL